MSNKNKTSEFWDFVGSILILLFIGACFYGCYKVHRWIIPTDYVKEIEEALVEKDFQQANQLLREMKDNSYYQKSNTIFGEVEGGGYPIFVENYNKVFQAEISYLVNEGDQQSSDRLIALVNEYPIVSNPAIGATHDADIIEGNDKYNAEVGKFNDYCNQILSRSISTKNQYLAEAIVNTFKPTLERKKVDTHLFGSDEYDNQYVETDKEKAKKILKEAIKEGKFNNQN